jgi:hypothetical protein
MRRLGRLIAALALTSLWIVAVTTSSARTTGGARGAPAARAAASPVVPADGATYAAGTDFQLPCVSPTPRPNVHALNSWLERADPRVPPHVYPAKSAGWGNDHPNLAPPRGVWPTISQAAKNDYQALSPSPGAWTCAPADTHADGVDVPEPDFQIWTPGYYHMIEFDVTESHTMPPPSTYPWPPDSATCSDDIGGSPYVSAIGPYNDGRSIVTGHCRHYIGMYFTVVASGDCKGVAGPPYIGAPYINQYDWGNSSGGPPRDQYGPHGTPGGNACGASSLSMMLFNANNSRPGTKSATAVYNETAIYPPQNGISNGFNFEKARTELVSAGYLAARVVYFHGQAGPNGVAEENDLSEYLKQGPVLTSTLFGDGPWSAAGGGHVILVLRQQAAQGAGESPGDYIVADPAGPFFQDPRNHYAPGQCGYLAHYPVTWTAALTMGRWGLLLGPQNRVPFFFSGDHPSAGTARAGHKGHTAVLLEVPNGVSVWVQDRAGHRTGFVGGNQTRGLSDISLDDEPQAASNPQSPFSTAALKPAPAIIALDPGKSLTLVARGRRGHRITAQMFVYRNGKLIKTVTARAVLRSGATKLLSLPSVAGGHNAPLAQLSLKVKLTAGLAPGLVGLSVSARAPFAGFVNVTVTQGGRTVGAGAKQVRTGPFTVPVFLFPGIKGTVTVTATLSGSGQRITASTTTTV